MVDADEPGEAGIRARQRRLLLDVAWPVVAMSRGTVVAAALGAAVGLVVAIIVGTWQAALIGGGAAAGGTLLVAWSPILRREVRAAFELVNDHDCHELAEWRRETGSPFPKSVPAMRSWLAEHPSGPGRASILLRMGRLDAARAAIDAMSIDDPHAAFAVRILRETATVFGGGEADLGRLRAEWEGLPRDRETEHQRECLAMLEALGAVNAGRDPTPVLSSARDELGGVQPAMRAGRILSRWALIPAGAVVVAAAGASIVLGR